MAKLPKKKTMQDTLHRVKGYAIKLYTNDRMSSKDFSEITNALLKLDRIINK